MPAKHPAAVALGKLAKGHTSPAKAAASRENGKRGGRPKKEMAHSANRGPFDPDSQTTLGEDGNRERSSEAKQRIP